MSKVTTYDPKKVTVALGNHIASGFADDSFVTIEPVGDGVSYVQGCDGEIARSIDPSTLYTVKIALLQNSNTNDFLETKRKLDKNDGTGTFSVTISDILGGQKFVASQGWITKNASFGRGKAQTNREWEIVCEGDFK